MRRAHTVENNLAVWDREHDWRQDGNEWAGQAARCGVPYAEWKQALVEHVMAPYASGAQLVVEIAPGHGRWSEYIIALARRAVLVDLSPRCIEFCRRRFADRTNVEYYLTDGTSLPSELTGRVDLVWSYDAFVHMAPETIAAYLEEIRRVLRPGGTAVLHHAGRRHWSLAMASLAKLGPLGRRVFRWLSMGGPRDEDGWRSLMSRKRMRWLAAGAGLVVLAQIQRWGPDGRYGVPRFNDCVTLLGKPS